MNMTHGSIVVKYLAESTATEKSHVTLANFDVDTVIEQDARVCAVHRTFKQLHLRVMIDKDTTFLAVFQPRFLDRASAAKPVTKTNTASVA